MTNCNFHFKLLQAFTIAKQLKNGYMYRSFIILKIYLHTKTSHASVRLKLTTFRLLRHHVVF